jgi:hypothetical protein
LLAVVRIETRLIHHSQYFTGFDIDHDDGSGLRAMLRHGGF